MQQTMSYNRNMKRLIQSSRIRKRLSSINLNFGDVATTTKNEFHIESSEYSQNCRLQISGTKDTSGELGRENFKQ